MSIDSLTTQQALAAVAKIASVGVVVNTAEYLYLPAPLRDSGLMSWTVGSLRQPWLATPPAGPVLDFFLMWPRVLALQALRLLLALAIVMAPVHLALSPWLLVPAAAGCGLFTFRNRYGQDGADQMTWMLQFSLAIVALFPTSEVQVACLWFVALQACLSYATAGLAKATHPKWRSGEYLVKILGTRIYGNSRLEAYLAARSTLARLLALGVITWEALFPVVLLLSPRYVALVLCSAVAFHLLNSFVMGLNTFFWAFVATYPAILFATSHRPW